MGGVFRYRGRELGADQIEFLRRLIRDNPDYSRRKLSAMVCEAWDWRQPNGRLCDMICRGLLLALEREGLLKLPPRKMTPANPLAGKRKKPPFIQVDRSPIRGKLKSLGAIEIRSVRRTQWEGLLNSLIEHHHYLGYCHPVGEQIKYLVSAGDRPIGGFTFSSQAILGDWLALAAGFSMGAYLIIGGRLRERIDILSYLSVIYTFSAVILLVVTLLSGYSFFGYSPVTYIMILLLTLVPQLIGHTCLNLAVRLLPVIMVSVAILGEPVGATLLGYFILGEVPTLNEIGGGILVLGGIFIVMQSARHLRLNPRG